MTVTDLIRRHEGCILSPYRDSRGILTVAVGHNLEAHPLPGETYPLTAARAEEIFAADLEVVRAALAKALPWLGLPDDAAQASPRQAVLLDMGFNLGPGGILAWTPTLTLCEAGQWPLAAAHLRGSLWARQVGPRAQEDAAMLESGLWPDDAAFPGAC